MTRTDNDRSIRRSGLPFLALLLWCSFAESIEWPRELDVEGGTVVVYQPQPESLAGNVLRGRAAIALEKADNDEPVFGAMWFEARIDTDSDTGSALIRQVTVTRMVWPDSDPDREQQLRALVNESVPRTAFEISMERLSASLESAKTVRDSLAELKNEPPAIVFRNQLAVLLLFDGEPRFTQIEASRYERAMNTPMAVVHDRETGQYFLTNGQHWYSANRATGPWNVIQSPPTDLARMADQARARSSEADAAAPEESTQGADRPPPAVVVATEPTELISTDGKPEWRSLPDSDLLYVYNTESVWLRDVASGDMYILLSGRWFRSKSSDGPWSFVRSDQLPASFSQIPPASDIGGVRTAVAGTREADQAVSEAAIPQTAAIQRSEASLEVTYDGEPKFEPISGTNVAYAMNTATQVLRIADHFYAVDNGVWFQADQPTGPWTLADQIPDHEIEKIPPSSPVYNTTYVKVYESTPDVVYVGYTPGYLWSFPYYGVPVYGTGWYYPPYWGNLYYPRVPTWGFHVGYNPWTGWNAGLSWSNGFFSFGIGWSEGWGGHGPWGCCGGWFGGGYRGPAIINTGDINIGNNINVGNRTNIGNRIGTNDRFTNLGNQNLYSRPENRGRLADPAIARQNLRQSRPAVHRPNNVYTDRHGNLARREGDQWQSRAGDQWRNLEPGTRAQARDRVSDRATRTGINRQDLNRSYRARQTGRSWERSRAPRHRAGGFRRR